MVNDVLQVGRLKRSSDDNPQSGRVYSTDGISPCLDSFETPKVIGGIGKKNSNKNTQWRTQRRVYDDGVAISLTTDYRPYYKDDLRIRKLTPKECWRLMGFDDEDFEKAAKVNSKTRLYQQAGNSIVVNVLEAILNNLFLEQGKQMTIFDLIRRK